MKSTAVLTVRVADTETRGSLAAVLAPDNVGLPKGLSLSTTVSGSCIAYRVAAGSAEDALVIVLALLRDIQLFQEVWLLSHRKDPRVGRDDSN